jgi:RNA polymerase sigma-70 factor (ECF subfamily)
MNSTSATLLHLLKGTGIECEAAWVTFCERYEPIIAGFARRQGIPGSQVPDVVQQVILGFFAAQPRFVYDPARGRFRGYLKSCVAHEVQRVRTSAAASARREEAVAVPDLAAESVDLTWDAEWEAQQLRQALERVRARYREGKTFEAFHRTFVLDQPAEQVAADLQMSLNSIYQARARVLAKLRIELAAVADLMGD